MLDSKTIQTLNHDKIPYFRFKKFDNERYVEK